MRTNTIIFATVLIFSGSLLSACGGGNKGNNNANRDNFMQEVTTIADVKSEDTEPVDVQDVTVTSPENQESEPIS